MRDNSEIISRKGAKFGTRKYIGGLMQKGKKIIAIGERDGVTGPVIAECLEGAGYEVVFQATECFV
jgi:betaine reductase